MTNRWQCPACHGRNVQISLPARHIENTDFTIKYIETDIEAEILWWYCPDCNESDTGQPEEAREHGDKP